MMIKKNIDKKCHWMSFFIFLMLTDINYDQIFFFVSWMQQRARLAQPKKKIKQIGFSSECVISAVTISQIMELALLCVLAEWIWSTLENIWVNNAQLESSEFAEFQYLTWKAQLLWLKAIKALHLSQFKFYLGISEFNCRFLNDCHILYARHRHAVNLMWLPLIVFKHRIRFRAHSK